MGLGITEFGIAHVGDDGTCRIRRPGKNGGRGAVLEVDEKLTEEWRLASGDVVEGDTLPVFTELETLPEAVQDDTEGEEVDEPAAVRGLSVPAWLTTQITPSEKLVSIRRVNGLAKEEALERPFARRRTPSERTPPDRHVALAVPGIDPTGLVLDFTAPLGLGYSGIVEGAHGAGLTRTLRSVATGVTRNAPDVVLIVLLLRVRSEEWSDWRRRFPDADIVVCPTAGSGGTAEQALTMANLVLAAAQRQSELGRDVVLIVDSLTGLWGSMLEVQSADAQSNADRSQARWDIREWVQKAGNFGGAGPLGGALGGSLTIVGSVWTQGIDSEAEEEGEVHPHLRLLEHIVHETGWRVALRAEMAARRDYPAIDAFTGVSRHERELLGEEGYDRLARCRAELRQSSAGRQAILAAAEESESLAGLLDRLCPAPAAP